MHDRHAFSSYALESGAQYTGHGFILEACSSHTIKIVVRGFTIFFFSCKTGIGRVKHINKRAL